MRIFSIRSSTRNADSGFAKTVTVRSLSWCSFKHDERGLNEIRLPFYFVNLYLKNTIDVNHKRLNIFESITNGYEDSPVSNNNYNDKKESLNIVHLSSASTSALSNDESNSDNDDTYTHCVLEH